MLVEESHDGAVLVTHASRGIASDAASVARVPLGRGLIGQLTERGRSVIIDNPRELGDVVATLGLDQTASFLAVPLIDEGHVDRAAPCELADSTVLHRARP